MKEPGKNHVIAASPRRVRIRILVGGRLLNVAINETKFVLGTQRYLHVVRLGGVIISIKFFGDKNKVRVIRMMNEKRGSVISVARGGRTRTAGGCRKKNQEELGF